MHNALWSLTTGPKDQLAPDLDHPRSGQTIPGLCQVANSQHITVPVCTQDVPIQIHMLAGQGLDHPHAFYQPAPLFFDLGLSLEAMPLLGLDSRSTILSVCNTQTGDILIPKATPLGWLISTDFHDFELSIPILGCIPPTLLPEDSGTVVVYT